jgi:hypothetical protein
VSAIKRGDWVQTIKDDPGAVVGFVLRVARDQSWADVSWRSGGVEWTKRMKPEHLRIVTRLKTPIFDVIDLTREMELGQPCAALDAGKEDK